MRVDGAACGQPVGEPARPAGERLPARAPRAREGRARRAGAPTSTSSSRRCGRRAPRRARPTPARSPSATRCWRASAPGPARADSLDAGTRELAGHGVAADGRPRARRSTLLAPLFAARAAGARACPSAAELAYRPRSDAGDAGGLAAELARAPRGGPRARLHGARARTATTSRLAHGGGAAAHLRLAGPAAGRRCWRSCSPSATCSPPSAAAPPLMLLDDVMSELDAARRELLAELLRAGGQAVLTTTDARPRARRGDAGDRASSRWPRTATRGTRRGGRGVRRRRRRGPLGRGARAADRASARPPTLLARVQACLARGRRATVVAAEAEPVSERGGTRHGRLPLGGLGAGARAARAGPPRAPQRGPRRPAGRPRDGPALPRRRAARARRPGRAP